MQKGFGVIYIVVGLFIVLSVIGGVFYLGKVTTSNVDTKSLLQSLPSSSPIASITSQPSDEISTWKTYTNLKFNYTIKYPQSLVYKNLSNGDVKFYLRGEENNKDQLYDSKNMAILYRGEVSPEEAVQEELTGRPFGAISFNNASGVKISDMDFDYFLRSDRNIGPTLRLMDFIPDESVKTKEEAEHLISTFKQMLTTFKFLDQQQVQDQQKTCNTNNDCSVGEYCGYYGGDFKYDSNLKQYVITDGPQICQKIK